MTEDNGETAQIDSSDETYTDHALRAARRNRRLMHAVAAVVALAFAASATVAVITDRAWPWIGAVSTGVVLLFMFVMVFPRGNASVALWEREARRMRAIPGGKRWKVQGFITAAYGGGERRPYTPTYWRTEEEARGQATRLYRDHGPGMVEVEIVPPEETT